MSTHLNDTAREIAEEAYAKFGGIRMRFGRGGISPDTKEEIIVSLTQQAEKILQKKRFK